ncbi:hypothetical protein V9T40_007883 [Parthenolecanium corni]|uniref:Protein hook n=1 Tax=Parthenolecanium corni TaxID=536013 RepID=A0AAN9TMI2_9HEMI
MSKYELCNSLLKWLQTFQLDESHGSYATLDDITDGVAMAQVLHQIAPEWFSPIWLSKIKTDVGDNWRLKVSNLKKIIESVTDYYQEYVNPSLDFVKPDAVRIGEHKDPSELVKLLQLILGCAVNCNRKQEYIQQIMQMEESVQNVIMESIQELENLLGSAPLSFSSNLNAGPNVQIDQLVGELQLVSEARDRFLQKCNNLEGQVTILQEEKSLILEEKKRLEDQLRTVNDEPVKDNNLRKQLDALNEQIFKLETSRDDYRLKLEIQEKEMAELQQKFDLLQQAAAEARQLKDEVDILREEADKAEKLESTLQSYKKKLEELSALKRQVKALEDKNLQYAQQHFELENELKKANTWKTQAEMYKKQVAELRNNLNEETKKLDKMEFENMKAQEKLNALQREKERLIVERDSLKEANDELLCNKLQLKENSPELAIIEGDSNTISGGMMSIIELKRELVKLQHENTVLKVNQKQSEDEKLPLLQTMHDDLSQQCKQLQIDCRQANQRIMQLEAELKEANDLQAVGSGSNNSAIKELQSQLVAEKALRASESSEKDRLLLELKHVKTVLFEAIAAKDQECEELMEKYKKCLEKAKSVMKSLDCPELLSMGDQINLLRTKGVEKDNLLEEVESKFRQSKAIKETEEKLMASVFYNFAQKKQQESMDQRFINSNSVAGHLPFLVRQRQSGASRRIPYSSK